MSLYRHPKNGILLLLVNTSRRPGKARIQLDLSALGLSGAKLSVRVANKDGHAFTFERGVLRTELAGDDLVMFRITSP